MNSIIKTYQVGAVAIATPDDVAELERSMRLAAKEFLYIKNSLAGIDDDLLADALKDADGHLIDLWLTIESLVEQLDAAHSYELFGPFLAIRLASDNNAPGQVA